MIGPKAKPRGISGRYRNLVLTFCRTDHRPDGGLQAVIIAYLTGISIGGLFFFDQTLPFYFLAYKRSGRNLPSNR